MSQKNMIANRYEVIKHVGQGGMADVFLAVDTILNRHVAVKILRADLSSDEVSIMRFEREAQAVTALAHPNIVEVYDVGDYKGHHYIVMEYVEGKTLKQVIKDRGPLMIDEAVDIMKQLTSAIAEAHSRGIIHRDIKPQNVIVKSDGTIKILDFGIATAQGSMQLTQVNNVIGSVHYMAPELAQGKSATVQSDIYALGIVFFEMLAGDVPYKADQAVQIAMLHIKEPFPHVRVINPTVPQSVENIIMRATAKNPANRYQTTDDMFKDLSTCLLPEREHEEPIQTVRPSTSKKNIPSFSEGYVEEDDDIEDTSERKLRKKQEKAQKQSQKKKNKKKKKTSVVTKLLIGALIVLIILVAVFFVQSSGIFADKTTLVPDLINMTLTEAESLCTENNLILDTVNVTYELTTDTENGYIISTSPVSGEEVDNGTSVKVVVSSGIGETMDNYVGMNISNAQEALAKYSYITVETIEDTESDETAGTVIAQTGISAGELFDPNTANTVTLTYVAYDSVYIPTSIIGMNYNEAAQLLNSMGIRAYTSLIDPSTLSNDELIQIRDNGLVGTVKYSDPSAGSYYTQKESNYVTLYYYSFMDTDLDENDDEESENS